MSSVHATVKTIELARRTDKFSRFVLLQGQDYPLYSPEEIHDYFMTHNDVEFIKAKDISVDKDKGGYMKCCGYYVLDGFKPRFLHLFIRKSFNLFNKFGIKYRSSIFKNGDEKWHIYHGWAQFALTAECIDHIMDTFYNNKRFNRYIKHRFPPDEIYFQTIVHNSKFKDRIDNTVVIHRNGVKTRLNLTYFEYPDAIVLFTEPDVLDSLKKTGCLFVRKVNSSSSALLDEIDGSFNNVSLN